MDDVIQKTAELSGQKAPKATLPPALMKLSAPLGPVLGPVMGFPPNFTEAIKSSDKVTYWARHDKAVRELGYTPRDLETGLKQTLAATEG
jgi:nucleoside-diphosphate-sugar epimerase